MALQVLEAKVITVEDAPAAASSFGSLCVSGVWKVISEAKIAIGGAWKTVTEWEATVSGAWKTPSA